MSSLNERLKALHELTIEAATHGHGLLKDLFSFKLDRTSDLESRLDEVKHSSIALHWYLVESAAIWGDDVFDISDAEIALSEATGYQRTEALGDFSCWHKFAYYDALSIFINLHAWCKGTFEGPQGGKADAFQFALNLMEKIRDESKLEGEWKIVIPPTLLEDEPSELLPNFADNIFASVKIEYKRALKSLGFPEGDNDDEDGQWIRIADVARGFHWIKSGNADSKKVTRLIDSGELSDNGKPGRDRRICHGSLKRYISKTGLKWNESE